MVRANLVAVICFIPRRNGDGPTGCNRDLRPGRRGRLVLWRGQATSRRPAGLSKTVAQLEDWLGVRLLLRSTHGLTPTEAGRNFCERAKRSIEEAEEA